MHVRLPWPHHAQPADLNDHNVHEAAAEGCHKQIYKVRSDPPGPLIKVHSDSPEPLIGGQAAVDGALGITLPAQVIQCDYAFVRPPHQAQERVEAAETKVPVRADKTSNNTLLFLLKPSPLNASGQDISLG